MTITISKPIATWVLVLITGALCGALLSIVVGSQALEQIRITNDSRGYHFVAVNLLQGKGYYSQPVQDVSSYDEWTRNTFSMELREVSTATDTTPGYPLFLAAIYSVHGVEPRIVVMYQVILVGIVGFLMVLIGWCLWGKLGVVAGACAVLLMGLEAESVAYWIGALLTEGLAMFLLTASFVTALWAKRGRQRREFVVGIILGLAILTRPAIVFTGVIYGVLLLLGKRGERWRRGIAFAIPCTVLLGLWSAYASWQGGRTIVLAPSSYVQVIVKMGLRAETAKELTKRKLTWSDVQARNLKSEFIRLILDPMTLVQVIKTKLKEGIDHIPKLFWNNIVLGFALAGATIWKRRSRPSSEIKPNIEVTPKGVFTNRALLFGLLLITGFLLYSMGFGYFGNWVYAFFLFLPILMLFFRLEFSFPQDLQASEADEDFSWVLAWFFGYLAIIILTISLPRFMLPFMPVFYLFGVMAVPLLLHWIAATLCVGVGCINRLRYAWKAPAAKA